jgi:hypothetical protein
MLPLRQNNPEVNYYTTQISGEGGVSREGITQQADYGGKERCVQGFGGET